MKRRNADCGKLRRPIKRNKITEGMYSSTTVLYMKFLVLWAIVITADFMFMFRFEFLWPFWLLLRSVHDSFKYKGLAFSVLFVCIAITSDLVCLFFIPVHWLLFAASTYVWVQYVWHTDKGICLPTIILWMLFVYLEAGIRWKDSRHMPHLDLCRPFAAHCIGYPVVTLGFGFKSYVGYRIRQRKQREVAKKNEFFFKLMRDALPAEEPTIIDTMPGASLSQTTLTQISSTMVTATTTTSTTNGAHLCAQSSSPLSNLNILNICSGNSFGSTSILSNGSAISVANGIAPSSSHSNHNHQQQNHQQQAHTSHQNVSTHLPNGSSNHNNHNIDSIPVTSNNGMATTSIAASRLTLITETPTTNNFLNLSSSSATSFNDDKHFEALNTNKHNGGGCGNNNSSSCAGGGATANGHFGGFLHSKLPKRNMEKEYKNRNGSTSSSSANETEFKRKNNNSLHADNKSNSNNCNFDEKNKVTDEQSNLPVTANAKDKPDKDNHRDCTRKSNFNSNSKSNSNDSHRAVQYEVDSIVAVEPAEKLKGRRTRSKKENAAVKDNQLQQQNLNNNHNTTAQTNHISNRENGTSLPAATTNSNSRFHNSDESSVSSISSCSTTSSASLASSATFALSNIASKVVSKICESCLKFEADIKKYRSEISHMKQIENELRQKLESNLTTKSCLQAKQKECDELEKRVLELTNARHADFKASERRLAEERRQKQSLEAQLNNEKKARKIAEEKAARPDCSLQCKQRKQQMEEELKQLLRDLKTTEEAKQLAEQQGRKWEQELRLFEAEMRNRDTNQQPTEMLMNALAAMQDKNCTLEKNLSAETRVKLDLFSALGDAKRQLEISESRRRSKEDEVFDLKAKIAQLLAVMPTDTLCLPACGSASASAILRMNDTSPLNNVPCPASPMIPSMVSAQASAPQAARVVQQQQQPPNSPGDYVPQPPTDYCSGLVPVSVANSVLTVNGNNSAPVAGASNLDPNASVYTPKTLQTCQGGIVVVGGGNISKGEV